jgi:hypothetical protein
MVADCNHDPNRRADFSQALTSKQRWLNRRDSGRVPQVPVLHLGVLSLPGAAPYGFHGAGFDFAFFLSALLPPAPFTPPQLPFNPQFSPFPAYYLT